MGVSGRVDLHAVVGELAALRRAFQVAVERHDFEAASAAYAEDARFILPTGAAIDGRDAIEAFWRTGFEAGASGIELRPCAIDVGDGVAWELGEYDLSAESPYEHQAVERGRYLTVHRQGVDGRWRRFVDLLSPCGPAAPRQPESRHDPDATELQPSQTTIRPAST